MYYKIYVEDMIPKSTLLKEVVGTKLSKIERIKFGFIFLMMVCLPFFINKLQIDIIDGGGNYAGVYLGLKFYNFIFDSWKNYIFTNLGIQIKLNFTKNAINCYSRFSKQTTYKYPAQIWLGVKLIDAANALLRFVDWGLPTILTMLGTILSCTVIILSKKVSFFIFFILSLVVLIWSLCLIPLQKKLGKLMENHKNIVRQSDEMLSFLWQRFQDKETTASEILDIVRRPVLVDKNICLAFNMTGILLDGLIVVMVLIFWSYSVEDRDFAVYLILINSIGEALGSISGFSNQFSRYSNNYLAFMKLFEEIEYEKEYEQVRVPEVIEVERVNIYRGKFNIRCRQSFNIIQNKNYLVSGPSGSGKSTFLDAFMGFLDGIELKNGKKIGIYRKDVVVQLQGVQSFMLNKVSLLEVFRTDDERMVREFLDLFFGEVEMGRILDNLGERPYEQHIEGRLSGGQRMRVFLAWTLCKVVERGGKILFLDEPEQGLDPEMAVRCFMAINHFCERKNITVFWITHLSMIAKTGIIFHKKLSFSENGEINIL